MQVSDLRPRYRFYGNDHRYFLILICGYGEDRHNAMQCKEPGDVNKTRRDEAEGGITNAFMFAGKSLTRRRTTNASQMRLQSEDEDQAHRRGSVNAKNKNQTRVRSSQDE